MADVLNEYYYVDETILLLIDSCFAGSLLSNKNLIRQQIADRYYSLQYSCSSCLVIADASRTGTGVTDAFISLYLC